MRDNVQEIKRLRQALDGAEAVFIGAGAGLSTSAGYAYTGERFDRYFQDFAQKYHFRDMYSGGFYPYPTRGEFWAFWSRYIYINRYIDPPKDVYQRLFQLVRDKDYFVLTTNVDHCFQKAGFDRGRMFYTQGDYGLFQCSKPCHDRTYDNRLVVENMLSAQGYTFNTDGSLIVPEGGAKMSVPDDLFPRCPVCGREMSMNLRADETFVEDEGWHSHAQLYSDFVLSHREKKALFLDLGTGANTPGIVKIPFMQYTYQWPDATYVSINLGEAFAPDEILDKSILIDGDIGEALKQL